MRPPVFDDGLLAQVLAAYPLRAPRVLGLLAASNRNENYLVADAVGDRYVLRRYRRNPDGRRVEFQVCFQQHLYRQGFPTSRVIETMTGEWCVSLSGTWWVLFTHVEGTEYDSGCVAQVAKAGRWLAQFHLIAETFPGEEVVADFDPPIREWWENWDTNLQGLRDLLAGAPLQDELAYLEDWWRRFTHQWPPARLNALPAGWVHGD